MDAAVRQTILDALAQYRGDDLERAQRRFAHLTEEQLDRPYGASGQTCRQILRGYGEHVARVNRAIEEITRC